MNGSEKNYLVVGGLSGIGRAVTDRLLQRGHQLVVTSRDSSPPSGETTFKWQRYDVTDREGALDLPETLNGVIYTPGTITLKPFHRLTPADFERDLEINYLGAIRVLQQALPALKRSPSGNASIVLFSSVAAGVGMPFHSSIAGAKAALEGLARSLAAELAPKIRVNVIAPSLTNTPLAAPLLSSEERIAAAAKRHPLERIGEPAEVAEMVEFLLGEGSRFVTGQVFHLDGGMSSLRRM